ncbi:NAD(P)H-hydrate dehydratase [Comamonas serinivorans]|uniref:Bifunctional NAD(P)H-hydrate repair enzyme n=1 Tax=Comamonas serinivorans TaxID=1082851 RepID=A0A1Y0EQW5_9BURK|nr:NAD(P)H-hydrate dehydratase [Comamonas serinivorans]ARU05791.1 NAD(P)H-hydrate dehydratase [Comamonas serinivorans]
MHRFLSAPVAVCHSIEATRLIEATAMADLPPRALMQRAGQSLARFALAVAPHARTIWIACGPGNNGGDGMEAAIHLRRLHPNVVVTWFGDMRQLPSEAKQALEAAMEAGVTFAIQPPDSLRPGDLCIDALLGIGANRAPKGKMNEWLQLMRSAPSDLISVDVPSGLDAESGVLLPNMGFGETTMMAGILLPGALPDITRSVKHPQQRRYTLTFLSGKPGLLTGEGIDLAGEIWLDPLGAETWVRAVQPEWTVNRSKPKRVVDHHAHKGARGDVVIVGGAGDAQKDHSMAGACTLAGAAALHGGAGRVYMHLLDARAPRNNPLQPELMYRSIRDLDLQKVTAVCGCGGGDAVGTLIPDLFTDCKQLVLDADALNVVATDAALRTLLQYRAQMGWQTVMTPHPLEAARLLGRKDAAEVQANRLQAVRELVDVFECVVVLKGSGTLIAGPGMPCHINVTGNSRLATAGTGDVLAGFIGALMAQGMPAFEAACAAVRRHGEVADEWPTATQLTALDVAHRL